MLHAHKTALLATAACLALPMIAATPAAASTYERCDADGAHCVRISCDRDGDECWRRSEYYSNEMYRHEGRWVCDSDGDECRYQYNGRERHEDDHDRREEREEHDHD